MLYKFLFPAKPDGALVSSLLLVARVVFGLLLFSHGLQKLMNFEEMYMVFPDPLGVGNSISLMLAIFGEMLCSLAFIFGFLYRLAMIPMMFTMCVAFFVIHGNDPFSMKELPLVYLVVFLLMYIAGPGKFAIDRWLSRFFFRRKRR
ncbi:MAG: DoxX family protein [Prevotellaceae bacterium]|jgi:putative oxidoreductase|nr:DoxX family protein [Prevotellaceae bacterium]